MLEVIKSGEEFSHVVLMDDDVSFDAKLFNRLFDLLENLNPQEQDCVVGGAMLRSDVPWFHVESGAKWHGLTVEPLGYGLDIRNQDDICKIDALNGADYNAWWFCCIPIKYIREDNLPLPIFFQWDDVDFGLRIKTPVITTSSIAVWHDPFDLKRTAMQTYYSNRNSLIVNSCHEKGSSKRDVLKILKKRMASEVCLYRYTYADALNHAIEDYLKGPMWLCSINPEEYNSNILELNIPLSLLSDIVDMNWYFVGCNIKDCDFLHFIIRKITLNGYLLMAKKELTLPMYADRPVQGYRAKKILFYEERTGMGFITNRNLKRAIFCWIKFYKLYFKMLFSYHKVVKLYRDNYKYMTSKEMWDRYLNLQ